MSEFYVYVLMDPRKPGTYDYGPNRVLKFEPFYVGKGKGNRMYHSARCFPSATISSHKASKVRKIVASGHAVIVRKIISGLTEDEAFRFEERVIALIGRSDNETGPLTNKSDGGEGPSNPSEVTRKKLSRAAIASYEARSPKERKAITELARETKANWEPGRREEVSDKMSKAQQDRWFAIDPEDANARSKKIQKAWKNKSEQELAEFSALMSEKKAKAWARMSNEEKQITCQRMSLAAMNKAPISERTRKAMSESQRSIHAGRSKQNRQNLARRISEGRRNKTPEQLERARENYREAARLREATMTEAQRQARSLRMSEAAKRRYVK